MDAKNKFDYERVAFENAFADKRDKRIVLYGTGRMTATLLERLEGFNIVGLLDFIRDAERVRQKAGIPRADISGWADGAFGTLMRGAFIPTKKMREGFYYDNGIAGRQETAIFV